MFSSAWKITISTKFILAIVYCLCCALLLLVLLVLLVLVLVLPGVQCVGSTQDARIMCASNCVYQLPYTYVRV